MRPFTMAVTTLIQGLYTMMALVVLLDVGSPTFNLEGVPDWVGLQAVIAGTVLIVTALALGVIMHTTSRRLFHGQKDLWMFGMLVSDSVQQRFSEIGVVRSSPGGPTYAEILKVETENRVRRAGAFLHGMEYQVMIRAPEVYRMLQVYRDQYRVARGLIIPSAVLALILPFWDPVMALEVGTFGPFPIIRSQMFMLSVLASAVSYVAFRERAFRYAAAQTLAFVTLEDLRSENGGSA